MYIGHYFALKALFCSLEVQLAKKNPLCLANALNALYVIHYMLFGT